MTRFLLDTNVIINFSNVIEPSYSLVNTLLQSKDDVGTCGIIIAEFFSGLVPPDRQTWTEFFDGLDCWPINSDVAQRAGIYRYTYARQGVVLSAADTIIAAVAVAEGAILVTTNGRDFPMTEIDLLIP